MSRPVRLVSRVAPLAFVAVIFATSTSAHDAPVLDGKKLYLQYCSACHGESGRGDGIVSGFMTPKPTDLTQLAKAGGGKFPFMKFVQDIDGRTRIRSHGDPEMPVWGEILGDPTRPGPQQRGDVAGRIMMITEYIEQLQAK